MRRGSRRADHGVDRIDPRGARSRVQRRWLRGDDATAVGKCSRARSGANRAWQGAVSPGLSKRVHRVGRFRRGGPFGAPPPKWGGGVRPTDRVEEELVGAWGRTRWGGLVATKQCCAGRSIGRRSQRRWWARRPISPARPFARRVPRRESTGTSLMAIVHRSGFQIRKAGLRMR